MLWVHSEFQGQREPYVPQDDQEYSVTDEREAVELAKRPKDSQLSKELVQRQLNPSKTDRVGQSVV
jgi:hypothetical protein